MCMTNTEHDTRQEVRLQHARRTLSSSHERNHRRAWVFDESCILCRHVGKTQIEAGQAQRVQLTKELYLKLKGVSGGVLQPTT